MDRPGQTSGHVVRNQHNNIPFDVRDKQSSDFKEGLPGRSTNWNANVDKLALSREPGHDIGHVGI
jgi:hypothetical protein